MTHQSQEKTEIPPLRGCYAIASARDDRNKALLRMTGKGRSFPYGMLRNRFVRSIRQRIVILSEREGSRPCCHSEGEARSRSIPGGEESALEVAQNQRQVPRRFARSGRQGQVVIPSGCDRARVLVCHPDGVLFAGRISVLILRT